ncbi:MAG TPA: 2-aminoethylphosphonate--pyruvate transaminase [Acidimicrobiales bacterium]|nr:2-aminoethylphosphonate--pyruvate transaminase [Acidimicrobiales bacterium]
MPTAVPYLLTPGPLTTSATVKAAMQRDWGSRDVEFIAMNREVRERLLGLVEAEETHVCVPLQGSGTFTVEAVIGTLLPRAGKLLVLVNGEYGRRIVEIARVMGRRVEAVEWPEDEPVDPAEVGRRLSADRSVTHVAVVHCETTSGILNPIGAVAEAVAVRGLPLIIDSMSAFGALPLNARSSPFAAVAASANKCLEGVPGMGFAIIDREVLEASKGNCSSLSLDLYAQWKGFERNGQWRFTPPTHVVAALLQALDEHAAEGGVAGRGARYARNHELLVDGMEALGFECLLARAVQAPIIVTFLMPGDPHFEFLDFYERLSARGFLIYPGKLTVADSFRIGCIGRIGETEIRSALDAIRAVLDEMGVRDCAPAQVVRPLA